LILADTSIWIDHFRNNNKAFASLLEDGQIAVHRFVIGELSCGNLKNRSVILGHLKDIPEVELADHDEVLGFIEERKLYGKGIGWIDAHLLASALLSGTPLWTAEKKLKTISASLGILF